ncbi:MAG: integrase [Parachlamydiaceae bacterium]
MPIKLQKEYLKNIRIRYQKSTKKLKSAILSEFCVNSGYSRKHASRILNEKLEPRIRKSGPSIKYDQHFLFYLKNLWETMGRLCGKNMEAAIPLWLPRSPESFPADISKKLNSVSASTIDRLLSPYKRTKPKGLSTTKASHLKHRIPIRTLDSKAQCPGVVNGDTVAHCGDNIAGDYMNSLTIVDLFSGWTANRAIWKKDALATLKQVKKVEATLPFNLIEFFSDNGNEFINYELQNYFEKRTAPVHFSRTRAYKKNDACYVEQKNYTHVRKILGYQRISQPELVSLANEIYQVYWNPLQNFFTPSMKLLTKERVGAKIIKKYDEPKTPYQRLIDSGYLSNDQRRSLIQKYNTLNPFFLRQELDKKLKIFFQKVDEYNKYNFDKVG